MKTTLACCIHRGGSVALPIVIPDWNTEVGIYPTDGVLVSDVIVGVSLSGGANDIPAAKRARPPLHTGVADSAGLFNSVAVLHTDTGTLSLLTDPRWTATDLEVASTDTERSVHTATDVGAGTG